MIGWFSHWLQRMQAPYTLKVPEDTLIRQYESALDNHQQLMKAKFKHSLMTNRLNQLLL